ncbi:MAG: MFS transporter [Proteobacteria bacterium TMED51]|jgi:predicted MFS family arabinose efflux permease|nr:MAG: MFS transporter [Proteobacteria bacterium TMED51]HCL94403.1 MFS transporter [Gammaproteobacteria bacterium]|tara:strand:- start:3159 stop:4376 length:1218 start_codon:yes stop_codon:yes gene_type:complete
MPDLIRKIRSRPEFLLLLMAGAVPLSFATWQALLNNFAIERAAFSGAEIGILQSLRELPGFLAFTVVFLLFLLKEQRIALISLILLGIGTALTGFFPTVIGLYLTTVVMSIGFHYFETIQTSLSLQWIETERTAEVLGRIIAVGAFTSIVAFAAIWLAFDVMSLDFVTVYILGGGITVAIAVGAWLCFPQFPIRVRQRRKLILRKRYWLYYALTFLSGARRQIFIVFAGFLMVEKFGYSVAAISVLFLVNATLNMLFAARIGRVIGRVGERTALIFEYIGLVGVFVAYAFVNNAHLAAGLYIVDHFFFALAIAIKTYFQKIVDPADIASSAGVSFTINHIAAVVLPAALGVLWLSSPAAVFLVGAGLAGLSLLLSLNIPTHPAQGNEAMLGRWGVGFRNTVRAGK